MLRRAVPLQARRRCRMGALRADRRGALPPGSPPSFHDTRLAGQIRRDANVRVLEGLERSGHVACLALMRFKDEVARLCYARDALGQADPDECFARLPL